jgi:hypothetical protein
MRTGLVAKLPWLCRKKRGLWLEGKRRVLNRAITAEANELMNSANHV